MSLCRRRSSSFSTTPTLTKNTSYGSHNEPMDQPSSINISSGSHHNIQSSFNHYDNSKNIRRESSFSSLLCEPSPLRARSPKEIASSFFNDGSWSLIRGLVGCMVVCLAGVHGPKKTLPLLGGLTWRPIPYQVTMAGDVLLDLTLANQFVPKSDVTFPSDKLYFLSIWAPLLLLTVIGAIFPLVLSTLPNNNPLHNVQAGVCTVALAIGISEGTTQTFKFYVGRLRPNFYAMCGFDKETLECTNGEEMEMEARMSFPSGHSSLSYCGMMILVLFFLARVGLGRIGPKVSLGRLRVSLVISFAPLLLSFWCATSRLVDNWHHPSDVIAGSILGTVSACIAYHSWFPHIFSAHAGAPLSVIQNARADENARTGSDYMIVEKSLSLPVVGGEN